MSKGFTLIESLIAIGIFAIIGLAVYFSYSNILDVTIRAELRSTMIAVIENEMEIVRNVPYPDVGLRGGSPSGDLTPEKIVTYGGSSFVVRTTIQNIDDPFDGTVGGTPNDTIPADYKLVEIEASCREPCLMGPVRMTGTVAPKNLERATKDGSLFISVFDASGFSISGANVSVVNSSVSPPININDITNADGQLNFVSIATSSTGYRITATKSGYSSDRTYQVNDPDNPNPLNPDAMIKEQEITKTSFSIDLLGSLNFKTQDQMCQAISGIDFQQVGDKLIGVNPDIPKYSVAHQTDASGQKTISNLEWDTYSFTNLDETYEIAGTYPLSPYVVAPASSSAVLWMMESKASKALMVNVMDEDENMVNEASVNLIGPGGYNKTLYSGRRFYVQSDWSGGQYTSKTSNVETDSPAGEISLKYFGGKYATSSEELISSTIDFGAVNTTFFKLNWNPASQPLQTGTNSLKFQIAANNDNATWNFVGPNGSGSSYYIVSDTQIHSSHNGKRYLRYKVFLSTQNDQFTPRLEDINIEFSSSCIPAGQVYFSGLANGTYTMTVSKGGFENHIDEEVIIDSNWQEYEAMLFAP